MNQKSSIFFNSLSLQILKNVDLWNKVSCKIKCFMKSKADHLIINLYILLFYIFHKHSPDIELN